MTDLLKKIKEDINNYNFDITDDLKKKYKLPENCFKDEKQLPQQRLNMYLSHFQNYFTEITELDSVYNLDRNYNELVDCESGNDKLKDYLKEELLKLKDYQKSINQDTKINFDMMLSHASNTNEITIIPDNTVIILTTPLNKKLSLSDTNYVYFKEIIFEALNKNSKTDETKLRKFAKNPYSLIRNYNLSKYGTVYFPGQKINNMELSGNVSDNDKDFIVFNKDLGENKTLVYNGRYGYMKKLKIRLNELFDLLPVENDINIVMITTCRYCNNIMNNTAISLQYRYDYLHQSINNYYFSNNKDIRLSFNEEESVKLIDSFFLKWDNDEITEYQIGEWNNEVFKVKINDYNKLAYYTLYNKYNIDQISKLIEKIGKDFKLFNYLYYLLVIYISKLNTIINKYAVSYKNKNINENPVLLKKVNTQLKQNIGLMKSKIKSILKMKMIKDNASFTESEINILRYYIYELINSIVVNLDTENGIILALLLLSNEGDKIIQSGISESKLPKTLKPYFKSNYKKTPPVYLSALNYEPNKKIYVLFKIFSKYVKKEDKPEIISRMENKTDSTYKKKIIALLSK